MLIVRRSLFLLSLLTIALASPISNLRSNLISPNLGRTTQKQAFNFVALHLDRHRDEARQATFGTIGSIESFSIGSSSGSAGLDGGDETVASSLGSRVTSGSFDGSTEPTSASRTKSTSSIVTPASNSISITSAASSTPITSSTLPPTPTLTSSQSASPTPTASPTALSSPLSAQKTTLFSLFSPKSRFFPATITVLSLITLLLLLFLLFIAKRVAHHPRFADSPLGGTITPLPLPIFQRQAGYEDVESLIPRPLTVKETRKSAPAKLNTGEMNVMGVVNPPAYPSWESQGVKRVSSIIDPPMMSEMRAKEWEWRRSLVKGGSDLVIPRALRASEGEVELKLGNPRDRIREIREGKVRGRSMPFS